jgi:hypothetical protein
MLTFIQKLEMEINRQEIKWTNVVAKKKLKLWKMNYSGDYEVVKSSLPITTYLGKIYMIKKDSIFTMYSWCNYAKSVYLNASIKEPSWECIFHLHGENYLPDEVSKRLNSNTIKTTSPTLAIQIATHSVLNGYTIYVK